MHAVSDFSAYETLTYLEPPPLDFHFSGFLVGWLDVFRFHPLWLDFRSRFLLNDRSAATGR